MFKNTAKSFINILPDRLNRKLRSALHSHRKRRMNAETSMSVRNEFSSSGKIASLLFASKFYLSPNKRILFYPKSPSKYQVYYKNCMLLGYRIVDDPLEPHDIAIHFQPVTHADPEALTLLEDYPIVINRNCIDVSKTKVQRVFKHVFGYDLGVDPTTYTGEIVEKSDENYRHDGRIFKGPIDPSSLHPDCVYQRAINTQNSEGLFVDLRTPVYNGRVPLVYSKVRVKENRFGSLNVYANILNPKEVFNNKELSLIAQFAKQMGVDYAEMDILRDNNDGQIYIVDVNNTPAGPAKGLTQEDEKKAMSILSKAFESLVDSALKGSLKAQSVSS